MVLFKKTILTVIFFFASAISTNAAITADFNDFQLDVEAVATGPNINGISFVVLTVSYEGAGVTGIPESDFELGTHIVGPGGSLLETTGFLELGKGLYRLDIEPINGNTWNPGNYLLSVIVDLRSAIVASGRTVFNLTVQ